MKKYFTLFAIVLVCFGFISGCGQKQHIHSFGDWETIIFASCTENGEKERFCSCGEKQTQSISAMGHSFSQWQTVKNATCTENGLQERVCSCGEKQTQSVSATGHSFSQWQTVKNATCTEKGVQERVCSCGEKQTQSVSATGHSFSQWKTVKSATCTEKGVQECVCSCGKKETVSLDMIPHNYVNHICVMCKQSDAPIFVPDYSAGKANIIGNTQSSSRYALQDQWVYGSLGSEIVKYKVGSSETKTVCSSSGAIYLNINVVGDWIYFSVSGTKSESGMGKVRTDGSAYEMLISSVEIGEILVVKDTIYFTTIKNPYTDYAKDCAPLYSVSVNGGITKQLHDGYVRDLCANDTYLFFLQDTKQGSQSLYRLKHDNQSKATVMSSCDVFHLMMADGKLYYTVPNPDAFGMDVFSFGINGGTVSSHGTVLTTGDTFFIYSGNAYSFGCTTEIELPGLICYNVSTKKCELLKQNMTDSAFFMVPGYLIQENYQGEIVTSISQYNLSSKSWTTVTVK